MTEEKYTLMDIILMAIEITKTYLLKGKEEAKKLAREKFLPAVKKYFKIVAVVFLISLIPTIAAIIFYLSVFRYNELVARTALTWGLVWHIFWTIALVIAVMPITLAYDFITEGIKEGLRKNVRRIESAALTKLIFMLILYFLTPYFKDFSHLSMFFVLSCAVAYVIIRFFGNRAAAVAVIFAFVLVIAQSTVPDLFKRWLPEKIGGITGNIIKAQPLDITATECEKVDFFHPNGKPRTGYYEAENEKIKVFVAESIAEYKYIDSHFGYELTPITRGIAKEYCKQLKKAEEERLTQIPPPQPPPEAPLEPVPPGGIMEKKVPEKEIGKPEIIKPEPPEKKTPNSSYFKRVEPEKPKNLTLPYFQTPIANSAGIQAVLIVIDSQGGIAQEESQQLARELSGKAQVVYFSREFVSRGLFTRVFNGDTSEIMRLGFSENVDYLILVRYSTGTASEKESLLGLGKNYAVESQMEGRIISASTGQSVDFFRVKGHGRALSESSSRIQAKAGVIRNAKERIIRKIS